MAATDTKAILASLTLEEKISLLAGANFWETAPVPAKGVPALKTSDGPNGARGETFAGGTTAACFPAASSVASTFDVDLARKIGVGLGEETLTKGARCLLGPTVCTHRHPLGGRNFESFSEDPYLAGKMASQNVQGIQSTGVSATVKHYAVNEQETQRLSVDTIVGERALREIYLKPFEIAVKEAKPGAIMTAYNKVNGIHADSQPFLLQKVLRGDWGWDGLVMSDWGGVNSTAGALNAGLDLEMPGPTRWRKVDQVLEAIKEGKVTEQVIDDRALHILNFLERENCFKSPEIPKEQAINKPEHQALIREVGAKGMVLLKNENATLPLTKEKARGKTIGLFGLAKECLAHGGGSASLNAHYKINPYDALTEAFKGEDVTFTYSQGAHMNKQLPTISSNVTDAEGNAGFTWRFYDAGSSEPSVVQNGKATSEVHVMDLGDINNKSVQVDGTWTPSSSGAYYFTLMGLGRTKVSINGTVLSDQPEDCSDPMGFLLGGLPVPMVKFDIEAGKQYKILIQSAPPVPGNDGEFGILEGKLGVRLGAIHAAEHDKDILTEAVELAKAADYAIVFTGHTPDWETEGQDQYSFNLPKEGSLDALVSGVAAVNSNTIVVNSTGVAVAMPWLDNIKALVQTWFPGQEAGNSITDVLTGAVTPEGHLTCTFPKRLEDCPAYGNFPGTYEGKQLVVKYEEGVFVGYRHFDRLSADKVNFPFGFGLSYTFFDFSDLSVAETSSEEWKVSIKVANTGVVKGAIAVQVYVGSQMQSSENPIKTLAAFKKVTLEAGASQVVELPVSARDIAFFSEKDGKWIVEGGAYNFSVAKSAGEVVQSATVNVAAKEYAP